MAEEAWESEVSRTKSEKARAAAAMGQEARGRGWSQKEASTAAAHELQHALADNKPGHFEIKKDSVSDYTAYQPQGKRSRNEAVRIAVAPGSDMSEEDHGFLKKIFDLLKR